VRIGILGALSAALYIFPEIPVFPPIYKIDLSALPALVGGMTMGPLASLLILLIKDLTGLLHSTSMGVGELADFLMTGSLCVAASAVYIRRKDMRGAVLGMALGILAITLVGAAANYWIMIPFYMKVMNLPEEAIIGMMAKLVPEVDSLGKMILLVVMPFNFLKGVIIGAVSLLVYKPLRKLLETA
jgi:riboflavin transporter FmnP